MRSLWHLLHLLLLRPCLSLCPSQCICSSFDNLAQVQCSNSKLRVVPIFLNPSLSILELQHNRLHRLDGALLFYERLERLDLSHNRLAKHVRNGEFERLQSLQNLNLSHNRIEVVSEHFFAGLKSLLVLDLSHNWLEEVERGGFAELLSLVELDLSHNRLRALDPTTFEGLQRLRALNLNNNRLAAINDFTRPLLNVRRLQIKANNIVYLDEDALCTSFMSVLKEIDLGANNLTRIDENAFRHCRHVDNLNLSKNRLQKVPILALNHLGRLRELDLSGNPIAKIGKNDFCNLDALSHLKLNDMADLTEIDEEALYHNPALLELSLENCPNLRPISSKSLMKLQKLQKLSLKFNNWPSLARENVGSGLKTLRIEGLKLHCNCSLIWLLQLYRNKEMDIDEAQCFSTDNFEHLEPPLYLSELSQEELLCNQKNRFLLTPILALLALILLTLSIVVMLALLWRRLRGDATEDLGHTQDDTMVFKGGGEPFYEEVANLRFCEDKMDKQRLRPFAMFVEDSPRSSASTNAFSTGTSTSTSTDRHRHQIR